MSGEAVVVSQLSRRVDDLGVEVRNLAQKAAVEELDSFLADALRRLTDLEIACQRQVALLAQHGIT